MTYNVRPFYRRKIFWASLLVTIFTIGGAILSPIDYEKELRTDGPEIPVLSGTKLYQIYDTDTVITKLDAGTPVRFLGYKDFWVKRSGNCLVETPDGIRGYVAMNSLDIPVVVSKGSHKGDTVRLGKTQNADTYSSYADGVLKDGEVIEKATELKLRPAFEGSHNFLLNAFNNTYFASVNSIKKKIVGMPFENARKKYGDVMTSSINSDGTRKAKLNTYAFTTYDGCMYMPVVTFGNDSIVTAVEFAKERDRNAKVLKYTPLVKFILNIPLSSYLVRTDMYEVGPFNDVDMDTAGIMTRIMIWTLFILVAISKIFWLFGVGIAPLALLCLIMVNRKILYKVSDKTLKWVLIGLIILLTYYWVVLLMSWGFISWFCLITIWVSYMICKLTARMFSTTSSPIFRCAECRSICTMKYDGKDLSSEDIRSNTGVEHKIINRDSSKSTGSRDYYNTRTQEFTDTTITKIYMKYYHCTCCGHKDERYDIKYSGGRSYSGNKGYGGMSVKTNPKIGDNDNIRFD